MANDTPSLVLCSAHFLSSLISHGFKLRYHKLARSFFSSMVQVASELGESSLSSAVEMGDTNIIRAFEGGRHASGWYTGAKQLPSSSIERILTLSRDGDDQWAQLIPLDVKSNLSRSSADGEITWKWQFTKMQIDYCQAVLLCGIKDPTYIALVPRAYLDGSHDIFTQQGSIASSRGIRPLWTLHPFPTFPPELVAFLLPRKDLGKALINMQAYSEGHTESWLNEHTGAIFSHLPKPKLFPPSILDPDFPPWQQALKSCISLHNALKEHGRGFHLDFNQYYRFFGDCKVINNDGLELFIECKAFHCKSSGSGATLRMSHKQNATGTSRDIFSWRAQWDFLFTVVGSNDITATSRAFIIPRDRIPNEWWAAECDADDKWLPWPQDRSQELTGYMVNIGRPIQLARQAEKIFLDGNSSPLKASVPVPMKMSAPIEALYDEPWQYGSSTDPAGPQYIWSSEGFRRGFGCSQHQELRGDTNQS